MGHKDMAKELDDVALVIEDVCKGCPSRDSKECGLCENRLQAKLEELDLGGKY